MFIFLCFKSTVVYPKSVVNSSNDNGKSKVIPSLTEIQERNGFLPYHELEELSYELNIPMSKIYGIITFYSHFKLDKPGKYRISACSGTACHVKNASVLTEMLRIEEDIHPNETTDDGLFSLEKVACLGCCALAPVMEINGEIHGKLSTSKLRRQIKNIRRKENNK